MVIVYLNSNQLYICVLGSIDISDISACPRPCEEILYEPFISQAAISNLDIQSFLSSNYSQKLSRKLARANEVLETVNPTDIRYFISSTIKAL